MPAWNVVWRSAYHDSVTLMRLTRELDAVPGVSRAAAMMATPANRALLAEAGLLTADGAAASPNDLVIAVVAEDPAAVERAAAAARAALTAPALPAAGAGPADRRPGGGPRPRTVDSALRLLPDASLVLVSVPGLYAGAEALRALRRGLHVMLFSDNVPIATEVELKRFAATRDLFLMGPDCGSAIIDGIPLGFANAVPRGRIGIAAASGTGLQELTCHLAAGGEGVSHAIGVGGRDLSDAVGGLMMERALAALAADPATEVVCVVSKPPGASLVPRLAAWVDALGKPCVLAIVGGAAPAGGGAHVAATLEDAGRAAVALGRKATPVSVEFDLPAAEIGRRVEAAVARTTTAQRHVRGVFAGGTLAGEARALLAAVLEDVGPDLTGQAGGHRVVDLGEDVFTVGRPHPMIDGTVRRDWIAREAADPTTAVLLLDVILGYGAHPDPAGELLPALAAAQTQARAAGRDLAIVASVCGTDGDPQGKAGQIARLEAAGVTVMPSNAQAARLAARIATRLAAGRG
jgi:FdrA protein